MLRKLTIVAALAVVACFCGGCLLVPNGMVSYTLNPGDHTQVRGRVAAEAAESQTEICVYLRVCDSGVSGGMYCGPFVGELEKLQRIDLSETGEYVIPMYRTYTWKWIVLVAFSVDFPIADVVYLAPGCQPVVLPLASNVLPGEDAIKPVPAVVTLAIPRDPAEWEKSLGRLIYPSRPDVERPPGQYCVVSMLNDETLAKYALESYVALLERFPDYGNRERVRAKIAVLRDPPRDLSDCDRCWKILFLFAETLQPPQPEIPPQH